MPGVCTANGLIPVSSSRKWESGQIIRVRFLNGDERLHSKVRQYAREWLQYANLDMQFVQDEAAHIRVTFNYSTSWSYIGTKCLDIINNQRRQTMNLDPRDLQTETSCRSVILHEFGHVLGLAHEHQVPAVVGGIQWNWDVVHEFYWREQGWDKATVDAQLKSLRDSSRSTRQSSAFDERSIMSYPIPSGHARNLTLDWCTSLSDRDKSVISEMYPGRWPETGPEREETPKEGGEFDDEHRSPPFQASSALSTWATSFSPSASAKFFVRQHSSKDLVVQ